MTAPRKDIWVFNAQATSTLLITVWYVVGVFLALAAVNGGAASGGAAAAATSDATAASPLFTSVSAFYQWGETLVIPLLLGVFYLGAGYLFQRHEHVDSFASWRTFMKRKTIVLLTPFFAFTILTLATASVVGTKPELMQAGIALQFFGLQERIAKRSNASAAVAGFVVVGALLFILNWTGAASLDILTALELLCFYSVSGACFLRGSQVRF